MKKRKEYIYQFEGLPKLTIVGEKLSIWGAVVKEELEAIQCWFNQELLEIKKGNPTLLCT